MLRKLKAYRKSTLKKEDVRSRSWFVFKWEILLIMIFALIATLLQMIPLWVIDAEANGGVYDVIHSHPLRDNIWYSTFAMFVTFALAIFIGVFTEIGGFAGKFGSAIFVLVPSFVWLLSDRSSDNIADILNMSKTLASISFYIVIALLAILLMIWTFTELYSAKARLRKKTFLSEFYSAYSARVIVVIINIAIVLILGYVLVNYGVSTLDLARIHPDDVVPGGPNYDFGSSEMVIFIGTVSVVFAVLMIAVGLSGTIQDDLSFLKKISNKIDFVDTDEIGDTKSFRRRRVKPKVEKIKKVDEPLTIDEIFSTSEIIAETKKKEAEMKEHLEQMDKEKEEKDKENNNG